MIERAEAKQVNRAASSLLFPESEFGIAEDGTCPSEDFQRTLARIAFDNEFANLARKRIHPLATCQLRAWQKNINHALG